MTCYDYACPTHGVQEVNKPAARAGEPEYCPSCLQTVVWGQGGPYPYPMRRLYSLQPPIIRPMGYHLREGDAGYADFRRARELGELRDDASGQRLHPVTQDEYNPDFGDLTLSDRAEQELSEYVQHNTPE